MTEFEKNKIIEEETYDIPKLKHDSESDIFDDIKVGSFIYVREKRQEEITQKFCVEEVDKWKKIDDNIQKMEIKISGLKEKKKIKMTIFIIKNILTNNLIVVDKNENQLPEFNKDIEVVSYSKYIPKEPKEYLRSLEEIKEILQLREQNKKTVEILGSGGQKLCKMDYNSGSYNSIDILEIRSCPQRINIEKTAEHEEEYVYIINDAGDIISSERSTRKEAREQNKRYLIVTSLIFCGNEVLLQLRSQEKKIDPGKISSSAHGVAKELIINGNVVKNIDVVSVINMAIEINEELRYGEQEDSFCVKLWPGTKDELFTYAKSQNINDPNTIYLVPEALLRTDGYPLGQKSQKRTRAIFTGFIFNNEKPAISIDSAELTEVCWKKPSEFVDDTKITEDLQACVNAIFHQYIMDSRRVKEHLVKKALSSL
ncbi:MAG: hypothetical protein AAB526_01510 [Patescibacteria group bacterium]